MGRLSKLFPREAIRIHGMRKVWSLVLKWLTRVLPFCLWCWLSCKLIYAYFYHNILVVVQSLGNVWLFAAPWPVACQASLSFTISWSFLRLMSIESTIPSNHLILSCPLLLLPLIFPSIRVFSNELALYIRWPKYWSFSFSINHPCNLYTELISLQPKGLSRVFSSTTVQRHQFIGTQPFLLSSTHMHTWELEKP